MYLSEVSAIATLLLILLAKVLHEKRFHPTLKSPRMHHRTSSTQGLPEA